MKRLVQKQRDFFKSGATQSYGFRRAQLTALYDAIKEVEQELCIALAKDFSKSYYETYMSEIFVVLMEIKHAQRNLKSWMRPKRIANGMLNFGAKSVSAPQPRGVSLIIAPWNYPFQLAISPLVAAIAAGNCVVLKPSEISDNTSKIIMELVQSTFDPAYVVVVEGGVTVAQELLAIEFDHILFTGSPRIGKVVMEAASKYLTPVTLELGGKSPCIVEPHKNLKLSAERIISGKMFNAGQTCIAPDYLLVQQSIKEPFIEQLKQTITRHYGIEPLISNDLAHVVNEHHFLRVKKYLNEGEVIFGGDYDESLHKIEPTLIIPTSADTPLLQDEIFGPILPILFYDNIEEVYPIIAQNPYPLALYLFGDDESLMDTLILKIPFGGGCFNDTFAHLFSQEMPLGGVRSSGMGRYHGKAGFDAFTHYASVVKKRLLFNIPLRYPPYHDSFIDLVKKLM